MAVSWEKCSIRDCLRDEFPGEWGEAPDGGRGNAVVLRSTDIDDDGHVDLAGGAERRISSAKLRWKELRDGDVLLEASGGGPGKPVGRVALFHSNTGGPFITSNFFRTLRPASLVDSAFLAWRLQHFYRSPRIWVFQQQTTGIINLKVKDYLDHQFELPPLPEQRRIAEILDTLDEAIRKTEEVIDKLQQVKQGLLHDLLTRGIDDNGELRDPERHPGQFKDSPLGRIPIKWEVSSFGAVAGSTILGTSQRGAEESGDNLKLLKMGNLEWGGLDLRDLEEVARAGVPDWRRLELRVGDLLFNTRNTPDLVGKTAAWRGDLCEVVPDNNILRVRFGDEVNGVFLAAYMGNGEGRRRIGRLSTGTTSVAAIYWKNLKGLQVPVPTRVEQDRVVDALDRADDQLQGNARSLNKLRTLKQGLMDDLLTGRVRVQVPEEAFA